MFNSALCTTGYVYNIYNNKLYIIILVEFSCLSFVSQYRVYRPNGTSLLWCVIYNVQVNNCTLLKTHNT